MLSLCTLGGVALHRPDGSAVSIQRRPLGLLAFVAAAGKRGITREKALAVFWPDDDDDRARHSLAQTLYALRRACDADVIAGATTLRIDPDTMTSDIGDLEAALANRDAERAASLYTGAFLDGFRLPGSDEFERWADRERARLQHAVARSLEAGAAQAAERGDIAEAAHYWRKRAALDPLDARVALAFAQTLARTGDTAGAMNQARVHQTLRHTELGLPPDPALSSFVERLRADAHTPLPALPSHESAVASDPRQLLPAIAPPDSDSNPRFATTRRPWRIVAWVGGIAGIVLVLGTATWLRSHDHAALDNRRVVVAVFENQTSDSTLAPLGNMAADWISSELARTGLVDVVDSRAVFGAVPPATAEQTHAGTVARVRELARGVGAGVVVWGTYYETDDSLELHAHVTDVRDGALLREMPPVRVPLRDPMLGVQHLASRVMGALATIENPRLAEWAVRGGTPPAYDAYREFVDGLQEHVHMDAAEALVHYRRARAIDSTFLQPLLFEADAQHMLGNLALEQTMLDSLAGYRDDLTPADRDLLDFQLAQLHGQPERARDAADDMARLSPSSESFVIAGQAALYVGRPAEALAWLERVDPNKGWVSGWVEYWFEAVVAAHMAGRDDEALRLARRARLAAPNQLSTYVDLALPLAATGKDTAAVAVMDSAESATGRDGWRYDEALDFVADAMAVHGRLAAAKEMWARDIAWYDRRPRDASWPPDMKDTRIRVLVHLGRYRDAASLAHKLVTAHPDNPTFLGTLGVADAAEGDSAGARAAVTRLTALARQVGGTNGGERGTIARARARVLASLGDEADAVASLREAMMHGTIFSFHLHHGLDFQSLRSYEPFRELVRPHG